MSKVLIILIITLGFLIIFVSYFGLYQANSFIGRASTRRNVVSIQNSYIFSVPMAARANGQEKIRVTLFLLNEEGLGVPGRELSIAPNKELNFKIIQGISDNSGRVIFDVSSSTAGEYYVPFRIDNTELQKQAHVKFN